MYDDIGRLKVEAEELEARLAELPDGYISIKMINGKERYYHQWYEEGKQHAKYVRVDDYPELRDRTTAAGHYS